MILVSRGDFFEEIAVMRIVRVPALVSEPIEELRISHSYSGFSTVLGDGKYIHVERVETPWTHALVQPDYDPISRVGGTRYPTVVIFVDEDGISKDLPPNPRISRLYYPGGQWQIRGDAILVGEDLVEYNGLSEPDFVPLPSVVSLELLHDLMEVDA